MNGARSAPSNLVLALVAALVVSLGVCGWLVRENNDRDAEARDARERAQTLEAEKQAYQDAVAAASAFVAEVTTYSFEEGEHDFDWVEDLQDEKVREQFRERVADLQRTIVASKTSARGQVTESAARVVDRTQVEVLAVVDQAITDQEQNVSVEQSSISLVMTLVGDEWLVDTLTFLSSVDP